MRDLNIFDFKRALPRMSWSTENLFNLCRRTYPSDIPQRKALRFDSTSDSLFKQRWASKRAVRAYHGDYIPEKKFKRWYLPTNIPDVRPQKTVLGDDKTALEKFAGRKKAVDDRYEEDEEARGMAPVGSLMFSELERRIDTVVFRSCFASSIYEARHLVIGGHVLLNGQRHTNSNTRLAPGDMISVDPKAIRFFWKPHGKFADEVNANESDKDLTPFTLPLYASPWIYVPAYIEPNFATCSAVYVRHPTARPGYSEIPSPFDADGDVVRLAWEWYVKRRPRIRSQTRLASRPEDRNFDSTDIQLLKERKALRKAAAKRAAASSGVLQQ
ncbi:nam9 protein [Moniliophthora roreri]|uniref:Putative nam9 protein n=1 Tax=Moniliophthora roreri TaxID=221103 RepID=A0A0W0G750_MONRR|nr:nam9 protein [Moniliophthora roreri]